MAMQLNRSSWRSSEEYDNFSIKSELVGYYSIDFDNNYLNDCSELKYYNPNKIASLRYPINRNHGDWGVSLDLNKGIQSMIRRSFSSEYGKTLFKWITLNYTKIQASADCDRWIQPNFVCAGGLLSRLLCTPYSSNDSWIIRAVKWKGSIYMKYFNNSASNFQYLHNDSTTSMPHGEHKKLMFWPYKFKQYILSDSPDKKPDTDRPIVQAEEFRGVYKLNIGSYTVLFDSIMDGVISETFLDDPLPLKDVKFIKLRTNRILMEKKQEQIFRRYKLLKWWSQDVITNTKECLCGFRDDNGIVHRLTTYKLNQIVNMCNSYWNPLNCIDFCNAFLQKISETVVNDCGETVYSFERRPGEAGIHITMMLPSSAYTVIPPSFLNETR